MVAFPIIKVNCYSGYKGEERPISFELKGKLINVENIIDMWHGEDYRYFKVVGSDKHIYILRYSGEMDQWEIEYTETKEK